ncbi:MAG: hypothetical protein KDA24_16540 [Deltaproteobacteria bacterium]|nr:hypothetical protein [Deltaproteobacteria bacterium]
MLLLEDTVRPAGGWLDAAQVALQNESLAAASGPVRCAPTLGARGRAWALHEYGPAIGAGTGERDTLPGHLLLLRREPVLAALGASDGLREDVIFPALRESGWRCQLLHGLAGEIVATDPRGASMRGQFGHGRGWSARESSRSGWTRRQRVLRLAAWPAVAAMHASRSMHGPLSPGIVMQIGALSAAWALGEGVGAVLGAGASEDHWA